MNYTVTNSEAKKITITITRRQLWDNYADSWKEIVWDDGCVSLDGLKRVSSVLCVEGDLNSLAVRKLFREGETILFMGDAMDILDNGADILREIIVVDCNGKNVTIRHEDISF